MGKSRASKKTKKPEKLKVNGLDEPVEVRRHPKARRMTLRVSRTSRSVIVTLPMQCDLRQAGRFLTSNLDWVRERLTTTPQPKPFAHDDLVPLRGMPHKIIFSGNRRGSPVVRKVTKTDDVSRELIVNGDPEFAPRRLRDWLTAQAHKDLSTRVAWHAENLGLTYNRISVRDQSSRWGSCSSNGNLSFSWRLILAPSVILDYVAAHEVCHLAEMNHGPRFWKLVDQACPNVEESKHWLEVYGLDLHQYGAQP